MKKSLTAIASAGALLACAENMSLQPGDDITINTSQTADALVVTGGKLTIANGGALTATAISGSVASGEVATLSIDEGGSLIINGDIVHSNAGKLRIEQNGGKLQFKHMRSYDNGTIETEGVNGNDIDITIPASSGIILDVTNLTSSIVFTGNCNFIKRGSSNCPTVGQQYTLNYKLTDAVRFTYTGTSTIYGGWDFIGKTLPDHTNLIMKDFCKINCEGNTIYFGSVTGCGFFYSYNPAKIIITGDTIDSELATLGNSNFTIVKRGSSTLTMTAKRETGLLVEAGEVKLRSRAEVGYPVYRLKVLGGKGSSWDAVSLNELYLMNGSVDTIDNIRLPDATASHADGSAACVFDRGETIAEKGWQTVWYQGKDNVTAGKAYFDIFYRTNQPLTGYTMKNESSGMPNRDPGTFKLYGSIDDYNFDELSSVEGYIAPYARNTIYPDTFAITNYPAAEIKLNVLSVKSGAKLTVSGGMMINAAAITNQGTIVFNDNSGILAANAQTTACVAPFACRNRYWKLVTSGRSKEQWGEFGMFDANGNRVNLAANVQNINAKLRANGNSSNPANVFDGKDTTCNYYDSSDGYWLEFELINVPTTGVKSHGFEIYNYNGSYGANYTVPCAWTLYTRANSTDDWTEAANVTGSSVGTINKTAGWNAYANFPFYVNESVLEKEAAFPSNAAVKVTGGATLDLTGSDTTLAKLVVDMDETGTLTGGSLGDQGSVYVAINQPTSGDWQLPWTLSNVNIPVDLSHWQVYVNGTMRKNLSLVYEAGQLKIAKQGFVLILH